MDQAPPETLESKIVGWYFNNSNYSITPVYKTEVPINKSKEFTMKPFLYGTGYFNDIDWNTGAILSKRQQIFLMRKEHFFNTEEEARSFRNKVI